MLFGSIGNTTFLTLRQMCWTLIEKFSFIGVSTVLSVPNTKRRQYTFNAT